MKSLYYIQNDITVIAVILTGALTCGIIFNQFLETPLPLIYVSKARRLEIAVKSAEEGDASYYKTQPSIPRFVSFGEFRRFVIQKDGLILDTRPAVFYKQGHVPGALSLPRDDFKNSFLALRKKLESDEKQFIILYCSSSKCEDSKLVQRTLLAIGFTNVAVFAGGWSEWTTEENAAIEEVK